MPYLACGINYKSASIEIREKFAYDSSQSLHLLEELRDQWGIKEAVLLSTCNRTEIYTTSEYRQAVGAWMHSIITELGIHQNQFCYIHQGVDALIHLLRVACGLDSMAIGEPQIFGQIKDAYQLASAIETVGPHLNRLFPAVFEATKQIRSQSEICKNPISLAYIVVHLVLQTFTNLQTCHALLIGVGEITEQVATYLTSHQIPMTIANRTLKKAQQMAEKFNCQAISLQDLPQFLATANIIVSATRSPDHLIHKEMIKTVNGGTHKIMIDLAVPRDIDPEIANMDGIQLYYLDDLKSIIQKNYEHREQAAKDAEKLIANQAEHYMKNLNVLDAGMLIKNYRHELEILRDQEIEKALASLQSGQNAKEALELFAHNLLNKIMHKPTLSIRQAAYEQKHELLTAAKELWQI